MAVEPHKAVATRIGTQLADFTLGTNLFHGPVKAADDDKIPSRAIFCIPNGGPEPQACIGPATSVLRRKSVQIRIRGNRKAFDATHADAVAVRDAVQFAAITDYIDVRVLDPEPNYLGEDGDDHPEFSLNAELVVDDTISP